MDWRVSLEYPNGRWHYTVIEASEKDFGAGFEFDLYGRRWRVGPPSARRAAPRVVCVCVEAPHRAESA
jgi:hypothetical protein